MKGICSSCQVQKYEVHGKPSDILPEINLVMCKTCIRKGYEPRHIIVIAARSGKMKQAGPYITNRKYEGEPILAEDILRFT